MILFTGKGGTIGRHFHGMQPLVGDIRKIKLDELSGGNILVHSAGIVGEPSVRSNPSEAYSTNVTGSIALAKKAIQSDYKTFLYVSTSHVYGEKLGTISEACDPNPVTEYGRQKLEAENRLIELFSKSTTRLVIVRVFSILGSGMKPFTLGGIVDRIISGSNEKIFNSEDLRDFCTPQEAAKCISLIAKYDFQENLLINLCSGVGTSVKSAVLKYAGNGNSEKLEQAFQLGNSKLPSIVGSSTKLEKYFPEVMNNLKFFNSSTNEG